MEEGDEQSMPKYQSIRGIFRLLVVLFYSQEEAELYQQMLANALAHYFEAKLLLLDATGFSLKIQSKYGTGNKESSFKRSPSESALEQLSGFLGSFSIYPQKEEFKGTLRKQRSGVDISSWGMEGSCHPCKLRRNASVSSNMDNIISQSNSSNNPGHLKHSQIYLLACIGRDTLLVCSQIYLELIYWMPEHQQLIVDNGALLCLVNLLKRHKDGNGSRAVNSVIRRAAVAIANLAHENSSVKTCVRLLNAMLFQPSF